MYKSIEDVIRKIIGEGGACTYPWCFGYKSHYPFQHQTKKLCLKFFQVLKTIDGNAKELEKNI